MKKLKQKSQRSGKNACAYKLEKSIFFKSTCYFKDSVKSVYHILQNCNFKIPIISHQNLENSIIKLFCKKMEMIETKTQQLLKILNKTTMQI